MVTRRDHSVNGGNACNSVIGMELVPLPGIVRQHDIRLGQSHLAAHLGTEAHRVHQLAVDEVNDAGGVLGGISTGQDIVCRFAVKPTSSILQPRATVDKSGAETEIVTKGRHDPCVGIRAVPVGEAMMACVILDHLLLHRGQVGGNQGIIG